MNTPEALETIVETLLNDDYFEHYWGLSIENEKIKIHYEYFGYPTHIPHKFMDKKLIPLHSHVGIKVPEVFTKPIKKRLGDIIKDELDMERNRLSGTTNPSHYDLFGFILQGYECFGICSRYTNFVKFSFYDPTKLNEKDLKNVLDEIVSEFENTTSIVDSDPSVEDVVMAVHSNFVMWKESKKLKVLLNEPFAAHLFIPI